MGENFFIILKGNSKTPLVNIPIDDQMLKAFPLRLGRKETSIHSGINGPS